MSAASSPISTVMTPESDSGSLMPESPPRLDTYTSQQSLEYRAMVRRLLERYSRPEIERLFNEEGCDYTSSCGQQASFSWNDCLEGYVAVPDEGALASEMAGAPSGMLQQQHEQHQELQQQDFAPPAASSQQASASCQPQPQSQKQPSRNLGALTLRPLLPSAVNVFPAKPANSPTSRPKSPRATTARDPTQRNDYACGFCAEVGIAKTCTRRNDLRRHMDQFHNTNAQWVCQHPGCDRAFDWPTAYQIHLRSAHGGSQMMRMADARVDLCPQTVFACGFQGCNQVLEAQNLGPSIAMTWKTFTGHLIRHCDRGTAGRWDYSHRMRNLLRQARMAGPWAEADAETPGLKWNPVSSRVLRKVLETGHVDDLSRVMSAVVALGSDDGAFNLELPVRKTCIFAKGGHTESSRRCKSASPCLVPSSSSPPRPSSSSSSGSDAGILTQSLTGLLPPTDAAPNSNLMPAFQDLPESASFNTMSGLPFSSYTTDYTSSPGLYPQFIGQTQILAMPSMLPEPPPVVFYHQEMPMAVPRAQDAWEHSYVSTGLQSPALTDASFLDLSGSPMSTPTQPPDMGLEGFVAPPSL